MDFLSKKFHFIAIGGVGMSALAKYLAERGACVSGSDVLESKYTKLLREKGVEVHIGHDEKYVQQDMIVVASSAIKPENPEIVKAKSLGLKVYHRSDILKMISDEFSNREGSYFIGFSGTHGKTTTSGLCAYLLANVGFRPSYVVGGIIPELNTNGHYDGDKYFSAELDESDGTIQKYATDIAVINNMEEDHLDYYKNGFTDIAATFNKYLSNKKSQKVVINNDNLGNLKFMELYPDYNFITFGFKDADYVAKNVTFKGFGSSFEIFYKGKQVDKIELSVPGEHNVHNALAVYAALNEAGVDCSALKPYFASFSGMGRRFQKVTDFNGIEIFDDYAHHPSEIKTTLQSVAKGKEADKRLVAIFQPHRYSRLQGLWKEFLGAFDCADKLIVTDVFSAGEDKIDGINSLNFAKDITNKDVLYAGGSVEEAASKIYPYLQKNDIVITLGAGTVTKLGKLLEENYKKANTIGANGR